MDKSLRKIAAVKFSSNLSSLAYYGLAIVLVALFIETFAIWQWFVRILPSWGAKGLPVAFLGAVFLALFILNHRTIKLSQPHSKIMLGSGLVLAIVALFLCDPQFPAKRIHVAEYVLISIILRRAICTHVGGTELIIYSGLLSALLGVHDELIQGLHPDRTFGLRDILVNAIAGAGGALIGGALGLFVSHQPNSLDGGPRISWTAGLVALGLILFLIILPFYRDFVIPWWALSPLLTAGAIWCVQESSWSGKFLHPYSVAVWLALTTTLYLVIANETPLVFH